VWWCRCSNQKPDLENATAGTIMPNAVITVTMRNPAVQKMSARVTNVMAVSTNPAVD